MSEGLLDIEANAAVAQQQVDTQEWNMQEIERQKRIQVTQPPDNEKSATSASSLLL